MDQLLEAPDAIRHMLPFAVCCNRYCFHLRVYYVNSKYSISSVASHLHFLLCIDDVMTPRVSSKCSPHVSQELFALVAENYLIERVWPGSHHLCTRILTRVEQCLLPRHCC